MGARTSDDQHGARTPVRKAGGFFGRRKGKTLRTRQQARLDRMLPLLQVDLSRPCPADPRELFPLPVSGLVLEIGCGGGENLTAQAQACPDIGFLGVEPFVNGMAQTLTRIEELGLANIRLSDAEGSRVLDWLAPSSLTRLDLFYPDPWPKRRHAGRRFVNAANLERIVRVLRPGGEFRLASDAPVYVNWALRHCLAQPQLRWTATGASDWHRPWADWRMTRYEAKAVRENRRPAYFCFVRQAASLQTADFAAT